MNRVGCGKNGCGSAGSCGCQAKNPYEESVKAVWHDPTSYDVLQHGPSFFPGMKLSSSQKKEVKEVLARVEPFKLHKASVRPGWDEVQKLLAVLRAAGFIHKTNHWQTKGQTFYGDHLLFDRLYTDNQEGIDSVAERIVGSVGPDAIDAMEQARMMKDCVDHCFDLMTSNPVELSLIIEAGVLTALNRAKRALEASGQLSPGTSNLLDGVYDIHEVFTYLLKQRAGEEDATPNYDFRAP